MICAEFDFNPACRRKILRKIYKESGNNFRTQSISYLLLLTGFTVFMFSTAFSFSPYRYSILVVSVLVFIYSYRLKFYGKSKPYCNFMTKEIILTDKDMTIDGYTIRNVALPVFVPFNKRRVTFKINTADIRNLSFSDGICSVKGNISREYRFLLFSKKRYAQLHSFSFVVDFAERIHPDVVEYDENGNVCLAIWPTKEELMDRKSAEMVMHDWFQIVDKCNSLLRSQY